MKIRNTLTLSLGLLLATSIIADRQLGTMNEFSKVEEFHQNPVPSKAFRERTLERNIINAIRSSLVKGHTAKVRSEKLKDIKMASINFEQEKNTFNYYVKYNDLIFFYNFSVNPELYLQTPIDERGYKNPGSEELERAKLQEKQDKSQTFSTGDSSGDTSTPTDTTTD
jgi:hypothetical protein